MRSTWIESSKWAVYLLDREAGMSDPLSRWTPGTATRSQWGGLPLSSSLKLYSDCAGKWVGQVHFISSFLDLIGDSATVYEFGLTVVVWMV